MFEKIFICVKGFKNKVNHVVEVNKVVLFEFDVIFFKNFPCFAGFAEFFLMIFVGVEESFDEFAFFFAGFVFFFKFFHFAAPLRVVLKCVEVIFFCDLIFLYLIDGSEKLGDKIFAVAPFGFVKFRFDFVNDFTHKGSFCYVVNQPDAVKQFKFHRVLAYNLVAERVVCVYGDRGGNSSDFFYQPRFHFIRGGFGVCKAKYGIRCYAAFNHEFYTLNYGKGFPCSRACKHHDGAV